MWTQYGTLVTEVIYMVKNISVRKLRSNLAHVLKDVTSHLDRYVISRRGEPEAVLMCVDDYEGWLETLEIAGSKKVMADIREAEREIAQGKGRSFKDVFGDIKKMHRKRR